MLIFQKQLLGGHLKSSCPKNFWNYYCKITVLESLIKTAGCRPEILLRQYSDTAASYEFWEMFQNNYPLENVWTTASEFP